MKIIWWQAFFPQGLQQLLHSCSHHGDDDGGDDILKDYIFWPNFSPPRTATATSRLPSLNAESWTRRRILAKRQTTTALFPASEKVSLKRSDVLWTGVKVKKINATVQLNIGDAFLVQSMSCFQVVSQTVHGPFQCRELKSNLEHIWMSQTVPLQGV